MVAEYLAILSGLEEAKKLEARNITIYSDNLPAIRHINGEINVTKSYLEKYKVSILELAAEISKNVIFNWIPGSINELAHLSAKRSYEMPLSMRNHDAHLEYYGNIVFISESGGCFYRIDLDDFSCSCQDYTKEDQCIHCHRLRDLIKTGKLGSAK